MTANEIRELSLEELDAKVKELKQELFNLKFQNLAKLQDTPINTAKIREVKRDVARIKTIITEKTKTVKYEDSSVENKRNERKVREGIVVSDKMDKTVVVLEETMKLHKLYKKRVKTPKKYKAHDEKNECGVGDRVQIMETRPLSREKRWRVVTILEKAK